VEKRPVEHHKQSYEVLDIATDTASLISKFTLLHYKRSINVFAAYIVFPPVRVAHTVGAGEAQYYSLIADEGMIRSFIFADIRSAR
jgi:hypothetical protein